MRRLSPAGSVLALILAGLAGFVDAVGFLQLGGIFASFMSGNSTRFGIELSSGHWLEAGRSAAVIGAFVLGAALGSWAGKGGEPSRRPLVLALVAALLGAAGLIGAERPLISGIALVLAMGAENAVFQRRDGTGIGLTYMTGALVRAGQEVAEALAGRSGHGWAANLAMWASLVFGAVLGAACYGAAGLQSVWIAVVLTCLLVPAVWAATRRGHLA
ncbi:MAG: hypothetical protein JWQ36_952 [Enterovirga sp.]|nr:hypothetical protein [Enterovirga sp.]